MATRRHGRTRGSRRAVTAVLGVAALTTFGLASSAAAADIQTALVFTNETSKTVEYGQGWFFSFAADPRFNFNQGATSAQMAGPYDGPIPNPVLSGFGEYATGYIVLPGDQPPTPAGNYQVYVTLTQTLGADRLTAVTAAPATLVVTPAPLTVQQRVTADPNDPANAIISAELTGTYVETWAFSVNPVFEQTPRMPVGTWSVTVTDGDTVLIDEEIAQPANRIPNLSYYARGLPAGADLTSTVTFTPSNALQGSFAITQAAPFAYTASTESRPVPVADAAGTDTDIVEPAAGPSVPLGLVILAGLLATGASVAIVLLVLRLRSLGGAAAPTGDTPPDADAGPSASASEGPVVEEATR